MKKRILIGIATSLFAIAMVVNINMTDLNSNVSLSDIETMAQAQSESGSFTCPNGCWVSAGMCYCNGWVPHLEAMW